MRVKQLFETSDVWIASVLVYLYGVECLARITDVELENRKRVANYFLAVPSEDAKIVKQDYLDG